MFDIKELENTDKLFDGRYKLIRPLNTDGATADVWLALDTNTIDTEYTDEDEPSENREDSGMLVAIKIYRPKNALDIEGEQRFRDEFKIAYDCHHTNLLQPTSFSIYNGVPYLVLPYCKLGSSEQLIGKEQSADEIWKFILDVSSGLARLHSNQPQIIHQDIKPANILIDNSHNYSITDFGISSQTNKSKGYCDSENSGTLAYMAPERFDESHEPIPASDIWAFGATLCEILTGKVPFDEEGGQKQMDGGSMVSLSGLPKSIKKLIQDCLQKDPKKRPTAAKIVKAAQAQQYPLKHKLPLFITLILVVAATAFGVYYYQNYLIEIDTPYAPTVEEIFDNACKQLNSTDSVTAHQGLHILDSLSRCQYVPAMFEVALTYGWTEDSLLLSRKKVLGIELDENQLLPEKTKDRVRAKDLFESILELNDSTYANTNAWSAYRMAGFFGDKRLFETSTGSNIPSFQTIHEYLDKAEGWALISKEKDYVLLKYIENMRIQVNEKEELFNKNKN